MLKALVVEDEQDIMQLLVAELQDKGYEVQEAGNGVAAIQCVREQIPDIMFVDVMLPVMDGFTLISKLRERPDTAKIPVVFVRDFPDQADFPGYSSLWVGLNYNSAFQGCQTRPDYLKPPAFIGQPRYCQA
ncbi:MAG: response regulator [Chloroflexi bacterium]|nr:response regulator [Chloroflexota bacterium]